MHGQISQFVLLPAIELSWRLPLAVAKSQPTQLRKSIYEPYDLAHCGKVRHEGNEDRMKDREMPETELEKLWQ